MADDPVSTCTECRAPVDRVFHPVAVHFKGSGFYTTDYGRTRGGGDSGSSDGDKSDKGDKSKKSDSGGGDNSSKSESKSESKSDTSSSTKD